MHARSWALVDEVAAGLEVAAEDGERQLLVSSDPYGKVCAGGIGAGNYPAFACIGS